MVAVVREHHYIESSDFIIDLMTRDGFMPSRSIAVAVRCGIANALGLSDEQLSIRIADSRKATSGTALATLARAR